MRGNISLGILFACIIAVFAFMLNSVSHIVVSNGVNNIDLKDAEEDMNELYNLLGATTIRLKHHVYDWAVFDEAYDYVHGKNKSLVERSFCQEKLTQMHFTGAIDLRWQRRQVRGGQLYSCRHFERYEPSHDRHKKDPCRFA